MRRLYSGGDNASLVPPLAPRRHLSIERRPLMLVDCADIAPLPLHLTLGITVWMLQLAVEAVVYAHGDAAGEAFCVQLGDLLRAVAGVSPAPYFGGAFEGKECQRIGHKLSAICDLLDGHAYARHAAAFRHASTMWQDLLPTLTRAADVPANEIGAFARGAAGFVDALKSSFEWVRITPKLHVLACHSPQFLRRFRSLGGYSEQRLETLHGRFNRDAALYPAATFLGSCRTFVKLSAIGEVVSDDAFNHGARRKPAAPGARQATKSDDRRCRASKKSAGLIISSSACLDKAAADIAKWVVNITAEAATRIRAYHKRMDAGTGQPGSGSPDGEDDGLLPDIVSRQVMELLGWSLQDEGAW
ncbi:hypothetical protein I4F81_010705 [Pyropia yezoensis]|uniref:Uncharacterized protein n=1 Tax=Pyropia yezoensis TaxID=2788 RepID=A0ACC3CDY6_PYRYE|nr:hypothetical protein I4F81_010705 [Neopyropia yezoensis]